MNWKVLRIAMVFMMIPCLMRSMELEEFTPHRSRRNSVFMPNGNDSHSTKPFEETEPIAKLVTFALEQGCVQPEYKARLQNSIIYLKNNDPEHFVRIKTLLNQIRQADDEQEKNTVQLSLGQELLKISNSHLHTLLDRAITERAHEDLDVLTLQARANDRSGTKKNFIIIICSSLSLISTVAAILLATRDCSSQ